MIRLLPLKFLTPFSFTCLLFTRLQADSNKKLYSLEYKTTDGWTIHAKLRVSVKPDQPLLVAIHGIWYDQNTVPYSSKLLKRPFILFAQQVIATVIDRIMKSKSFLTKANTIKNQNFFLSKATYLKFQSMSNCS